MNKILDKAQIGSKRYREIAKEIGRVNNRMAEARGQAQKFGKTVTKESALGKAALSGMALGGWGAVIDQGLRAARVAVDFGQRMVDASNQAQNATLALATTIRTKLGEEAIAKAEKEVSRLEKSLKGAMDPASIRKAMKNLVAANFTVEQSGKLIEANAKIASTSRQSHLGLAESVVVYSEGIKNQNSILTDATGISENLSTTLKRQGFTMEDLTDEAQGAAARQALFNRHMEEAVPFTEAFNAQMSSYQGHTTRADAATERLSVTIGDFLKKRLEPASESWANFLETLSEEITVDSLDEVFDTLSLITDPLEEILDSTFEIYGLFGDLAGEILGTQDGAETLRAVFRLLSRAINLALTPVRAIHAGIKLILGLAKSLVRLFRGDFRGALDAAKSTFERFGNNLLQTLDKVRRAVLGIFDGAEDEWQGSLGRFGGAAPSRQQRAKQSSGGQSDTKTKPTFFLDQGLTELEAAINLLEQGKTVRVDMRTITGGDLFKELEKAGLSEESSKILQKTVELEVDVLNEDEVKQLSNTSDVSGSTTRNLERARTGEGPATGTLQGTNATISTGDQSAAGALRELKEVIQKSKEAGDAVVDLSAKTESAGEKTGKLAQKIQKVLSVISELAGRASEIIQNALRLQLQALENTMARLNFMADFYLASFNKQKEAEIEAFRETEDRKIEIMREAMNDRLALIDEEFEQIRAKLEEELALKIAQLETEHLAQIDYIEANAADHEQELILKELQEEEFRARKQGLEREHEERVNEELRAANNKKESETKKSNKIIQKAEADKNKELTRMEQARAEEERKIKKQMAVLQYMSDLAGWNLEKQIARTQIQFSTAQAVMAAVASSLALPFPVNLIVMGTTTALAVALGAQQLALVDGQMPPLPPVELFFAEGGLVPGPALPEDSIRARLSGGEFVVNRSATARHLDLLEALNDGAGGRTLPVAFPGSSLEPISKYPTHLTFEEGALSAVLQLGDEEIEIIAQRITEKQGAIVHSAAF